ncbi:MAG TPA: right-handed parallel beta-helix repeat-containing protein [Methylomirabilota bacterium]|jgi:parallel beta-helix repeat protein
MASVTQVGAVTFIVLLGLGVIAAPQTDAATVNVDCNNGGAVGPALASLKPGDVLLVHGTCRENVVIPAELHDITLEGQAKATINAPDARQPAIQVLGREITIKNLTVSGGQFGIGINRGATAIVDNNTIENAALTGLEVSQNSFARIVKNTIRHNQQNGIFVLGSSSAHIGVMQTGDRVPQPNVVENNGRDGIMVLRSSTARIIGNMLSGNKRNGLTVQQLSHADVAGNVFNGNGEHGIRVTGNSGVNLADSAMRVFEQPNTTAAPNGKFGIRCEVGAYVEGPLGTLTGSSGAKDVSDTSCVDRMAP